MSKFLIVDDDVDFCLRVKDWFRDKPLIELEMAGTGGDGLQLLRSFSYELILLDWRLPDMTGLAVCKEYRSSGGKTHIIFLTGEGDIECKEAALLAGGDDYLVKPVDMRELYARARSVLRRSLEMTPDDLNIRGLSLKTEERVAEAEGKQIRLSPKECVILEYLIKHADRPYSASKLLAALWPSDSEVSEGTVRTSILNLRKKLAEIGHGELIKLVVNSGYVIEKD